MTRSRIRLLLKITVPIGLLAVIFYHIDLAGLLAVLSTIHLPHVVFAFLSGYISFILISALRWKYLLNQAYGICLPYPLLLRYYWEGIFVGYFVPGGVGADIYRALAAGKLTARYEQNVVAVLGEKLYILVDSSIFVLVLYAVVVPAMVDRHLLNIINMYLYPFVLAILGITLLIYLSSHLGGGGVLQARWREKLSELTEKLMVRFAAQTPARLAACRPAGLFAPFFQWRNILLLAGFTCISRIMICVGGYYLLLAVGVNLPLIVHAFVWTLATILFSLPISIGTLGVRESVHILLLGLFGVSSEVALAVSFTGLACLLVSTVMGGIIFLGGRLFIRHD